MHITYAGRQPDSSTAPSILAQYRTACHWHQSQTIITLVLFASYRFIGYCPKVSLSIYRLFPVRYIVINLSVISRKVYRHQFIGYCQ